MIIRSSIRFLLAMALLIAAGCATQAPTLQQVPLGQSELDQFLASGRDARYYGITTYQDAPGARFEFANRVHESRSAQRDFIRPRDLTVPVLKARTATFVDFHLLLDSSARQNWLLMASVESMAYRPFAPPIGEYADHVVADVPGYAGVANKIVLDALHVESPVFCVPPARGNLGALARVVERPVDESDPEAVQAAQARQALGAKTHAVMGAALMRAFAFIRFDFPGRNVRFSTSSTYKPQGPGTVRACLALRDWRGRPAVQASLDGAPIVLVIDTAGDFGLSLPGEPGETTGTLALGALEIEDVRVESHAALGLPESFPARLGLDVLENFAVTLDYKNQRVWFEDNALPVAEESDSATEEEDDAAPVQYRGINQ
jgi:hypothetical protein